MWLLPGPGKADHQQTDKYISKQPLSFMILINPADTINCVLVFQY